MSLGQRKALYCCIQFDYESTYHYPLTPKLTESFINFSSDAGLVYQDEGVRIDEVACLMLVEGASEWSDSIDAGVSCRITAIETDSLTVICKAISLFNSEGRKDQYTPLRTIAHPNRHIQTIGITTTLKGCTNETHPRFL